MVSSHLFGKTLFLLRAGSVFRECDWGRGAEVRSTWNLKPPNDFARTLLADCLVS